MEEPVRSGFSPRNHRFAGFRPLVLKMKKCKLEYAMCFCKNYFLYVRIIVISYRRKDKTAVILKTESSDNINSAVIISSVMQRWKPIGSTGTGRVDWPVGSPVGSRFFDQPVKKPGQILLSCN